MKVDKNILIDLFERKDKKRRKILYELYAELVMTSLSTHYVAEPVCSDLGMPELIDADDVRYVDSISAKSLRRFHVLRRGSGGLFLHQLLNEGGRLLRKELRLIQGGMVG